MVNMLLLSDHAKSGFHDLKVVIFAWNTKNVLRVQKVLNMRNWKRYSKKTGHFKSIGIYLKARKLGAIRMEAKKRQKC